MREIIQSKSTMDLQIAVSSVWNLQWAWRYFLFCSHLTAKLKNYQRDAVVSFQKYGAWVISSEKSNWQLYSIPGVDAWLLMLSRVNRIAQFLHAIVCSNSPRSLNSEGRGKKAGEKHREQRKRRRRRRKKKNNKRKETWHFNRTLSCILTDIIIVKLGGRFRLSCRCGSLKSHSVGPCHFSSALSLSFPPPSSFSLPCSPPVGSHREEWWMVRGVREKERRRGGGRGLAACGVPYGTLLGTLSVPWPALPTIRCPVLGYLIPGPGPSRPTPAADWILLEYKGLIYGGVDARPPGRSCARAGKGSCSSHAVYFTNTGRALTSHCSATIISHNWQVARWPWLLLDDEFDGGDCQKMRETIWLAAVSFILNSFLPLFLINLNSLMTA